MVVQGAQSLTCIFISAIVNPILVLLMLAAIIVFIWGVIEFLVGLSNGSSEKDSGKWHMFWGLVGLFVMTSAYAIISLVVNTLANSAGTVSPLPGLHC